MSCSSWLQLLDVLMDPHGGMLSPSRQSVTTLQTTMKRSSTADISSLHRAAKRSCTGTYFGQDISDPSPEEALLEFSSEWHKYIQRNPVTKAFPSQLLPPLAVVVRACSARLNAAPANDREELEPELHSIVMKRLYWVTSFPLRVLSQAITESVKL